MQDGILLLGPLAGGLELGVVGALPVLDDLDRRPMLFKLVLEGGSNVEPAHLHP